MNTIDDYVSENGIVRVDFIKADIEGAERDMLRGVVKILQRFKPKLSICTYHLKDDPEVLESIVKMPYLSIKSIMHIRKCMLACNINGKNCV